MTVRGRWGVRGSQGVRRLRTALLAVTLLALASAGCGIRPTEVPTEFGPAPSRLSCTASGPDLATQSPGGILVQVFLLCSSQLVRVDRIVRVTDGTTETDRAQAAQALLDQLTADPAEAERQAGYTTDVQGGLTVGEPRPEDPEGALRLSTEPAALTSYALAQIICTFNASAAASDGGAVILGGPGMDPVRRYECTPEVLSRPGTESPPSTEVGGP
ncbi:lipoprotein [Streptomyces pseudoechinosporeus]